MRTTVFAFILLFVILNSNGFAQQAIKNPCKHFVEKIMQIDANDTFSYIFHKIVYDFNNDGMPDVALSSDDTRGNAGAEWVIYFMQPDNKYIQANIETKPGKSGGKISETIFFDPGAACMKRDKKGKNIFIIYHRMSCCDGNIMYYNIYKNRLKLYKSEYISGSKSRKLVEILSELLKNGVKLKEEAGDLNCMRKEKNGKCWK